MSDEFPDIHDIEAGGDLHDYIGETVSARVEMKGCEFCVEGQKQPYFELDTDEIEDPILSKIVLRKDQAMLGQAIEVSVREGQHEKNLGDYDIPATFTGTLRHDDKEGFYLTNAKPAKDADLTIVDPSRREISISTMEMYTEHPKAGSMTLNWVINGIDRQTGGPASIYVLAENGEDPIAKAMKTFPDGKPMLLTVTGPAVFDRKSRVSVAVTDSKLSIDAVSVDRKPLDAPVAKIPVFLRDLGGCLSLTEKLLATGAPMVTLKARYQTLAAVGGEISGELKALAAAANLAAADPTHDSKKPIAVIHGSSREVKDGPDFWRTIIKVAAIEGLYRASEKTLPPRTTSPEMAR